MMVRPRRNPLLIQDESDSCCRRPKPGEVLLRAGRAQQRDAVMAPVGEMHCANDFIKRRGQCEPLATLGRKSAELDQPGLLGV
jgi:hypothetical protein